GTLNFVHQLQNFAISIGVYIDGEPYAGFILDVMNDNLYHAGAGKEAYKNDTRLGRVQDTSLAKSLVAVNTNWVIREGIGRTFTEVVRDARSTRSDGAAGLDFVDTVQGIVSAALICRLQLWDYAAGMIILAETGGITTNLLGEEISILNRDSVLAGNPGIHEELQQYFIHDEEFI